TGAGDRGWFIELQLPPHALPLAYNMQARTKEYAWRLGDCALVPNDQDEVIYFVAPPNIPAPAELQIQFVPSAQVAEQSFRLTESWDRSGTIRIVRPPP